MRTWDNGDLDCSITKVFERLKPVLCNIREADGANDLVECNRGKKVQQYKNGGYHQVDEKKTILRAWTY